MKSTFRNLFIIPVLALVSFTNYSQNPSHQLWVPPNNVSLLDSLDYDKYANDVISCKTWMETTPFTEKDDNWKNASKFMLQWVTGSPRFTMSVYPFQMSYSSEKNKSFLIVFMTGAAANAIKNNYVSSDKENFVAGFKLVNKVYQNAAKKNKDKKILELIKLEEEGKLAEWVENQMKKIK